MPALPKFGEDKESFMGRCISILKKENKPDKQRIAICLNMWRRKDEREENMDLLKKISILLKDEIATGDIESNTAKGKVDVLGDCPKGQQWCSKQKKCVPIGSGDGKGERSNESTILGGGFIDGNTNIAGSGQTRIVGKRSGEITILKTKSPDITTKFNKLLGIYAVTDGKMLRKQKRKKKGKDKKKDKSIKGPNSYGLMFDD